MTKWSLEYWSIGNRMQHITLMDEVNGVCLPADGSVCWTLESLSTGAPPQTGDGAAHFSATDISTQRILTY